MSAHHPAPSRRCPACQAFLPAPTVIVSGDPGLLDGMRRELEGDFVVLSATDVHDALALVLEQRAGALVADLHVGELVGSGLALLEVVAQQAPTCVRILIAGRVPPAVDPAPAAHAVVLVPWPPGHLRSTVTVELGARAGAHAAPAPT